MTTAAPIMEEKYSHAPVLLQEVLKHLPNNPEGVYLDATLGLGGHAEAILDSILAQGNNGLLIGMDMDPDALSQARVRLQRHAGKCRLIHGNFRNLSHVLQTAGCGPLSGALFDLGVSSLQFDKPSRGFSILHDGPLDMRMDPTASLTAERIVNEWPVEQLELLFREYGEERQSAKLARCIVEARRERPLRTTRELRELIASKQHRSGRLHPATRVFQALRITVNQELENLTRGLESVLPHLQVGGRIAVISFHSLEDRIVKNVFKSFVADGRCRSVLSTPLSPGADEIARNARARSAKLRVVERK
ncbi:MAG: 16S rRNA (cytosine(1402)-N(4))-methyltransferase RsmH [Elusimicrobiota bacterium]